MKIYIGNDGSGKMRVVNMVKVALALYALLMLASVVKAAEPFVIESIDQITLPGGASQVQLVFDRPLEFEPKSFSITKPARVSIDFPNTVIKGGKEAQQYDAGIVSTVRAIQAKGRSRLVVGLRALVPYEIRTEANNVYINFDRQVQATGDAEIARVLSGTEREVNELDFRRGLAG